MKTNLQLLGCSVHHTDMLAWRDLTFFWLLFVDTFWLTEDSVAFALTSCLGGSPAFIFMSNSLNRHFRFSVANKSVGFHIYKLKSFIRQSFEAYFHLWSNGVAH